MTPLPPTTTIRTRDAAGRAFERTLRIVPRMKGVSVVDPDHGDYFGASLAGAIDALCSAHDWTLIPTEETSS